MIPEIRRGESQAASKLSGNRKPSGNWEYNRLVRIKTSITLPKELLNRLDHVDKNRSAVLERAARIYLAQLEREARDRRDLEIIDRHAGRLNREAEDALGYQKLR